MHNPEDKSSATRKSRKVIASQRIILGDLKNKGFVFLTLTDGQGYYSPVNRIAAQVGRQSVILVHRPTTPS